MLNRDVVPDAGLRTSLSMSFIEDVMPSTFYLFSDEEFLDELVSAVSSFKARMYAKLIIEFPLSEYNFKYDLMNAVATRSCDRCLKMLSKFDMRLFVKYIDEDTRILNAAEVDEQEQMETMQAYLHTVWDNLYDYVREEAYVVRKWYSYDRKMFAVENLLFFERELKTIEDAINDAYDVENVLMINNNDIELLMEYLVDVEDIHEGLNKIETPIWWMQMYEMMYVRDLTREGIEPNPGWNFRQMLIKENENFRKMLKRYEILRKDPMFDLPRVEEDMQLHMLVNIYEDLLSQLDSYSFLFGRADFMDSYDMMGGIRRITALEVEISHKSRFMSVRSAFDLRVKLLQEGIEPNPGPFVDIKFVCKIVAVISVLVALIHFEVLTMFEITFAMWTLKSALLIVSPSFVFHFILSFVIGFVATKIWMCIIFCFCFGVPYLPFSAQGPYIHNSVIEDLTDFLLVYASSNNRHVKLLCESVAAVMEGMLNIKQDIYVLPSFSSDDLLNFKFDNCEPLSSQGPKHLLPPLSKSFLMREERKARSVEKKRDIKIEKKRLFKSQNRNPFVAQGPSISKALGTVNSRIEGLPEVVKAMESLNESVAEGIEVRHSLDLNLGVSKIFEQFAGIWENKHVRVISMMAITAVLVYNARQRSPSALRFVSRLLSVVSTVYLVKFGSDCFSDYICAIDFENFSFNEGFRSQGPEDIFETFRHGVLSYVFMSFVGKSFKSYDLANFLKLSSDFPKYKEGIHQAHGYIAELLQFIITKCHEYFGTQNIQISTSGYPEIDAFVEDVRKILIFFRNGAEFSFSNAEKVWKLQDQGRNLMSKVSGTVPKDVKERLFRTLQLLEPFAKRFEQSNIVGNGPRVEPLGILVAGPTGVGKSTFVVPFVLRLAARVMPPDRLEAFLKNHNDEILNRVSENEFHEGDHGQFVWYVDDFGQEIDIAGNMKTSYMEIFRAINTANWQLHMAHLHNKENTNFQHRIVMATSNRTHFRNLNSIYSPEALVRRFKLQYIQVPKVEFCTEESVSGKKQGIWGRRLDMKKVRQQTPYIPSDPNSLIDFSVVEYHGWDFIKGKPTGEVLDFEAFLDKATAVYRDTQGHGEQMLELHNLLKQQEIADRKRVDPQFVKQGPREINENSIRTAYFQYVLDAYSTMLGVPSEALEEICSLKDIDTYAKFQQAHAEHPEWFCYDSAPSFWSRFCGVCSNSFLVVTQYVKDHPIFTALSIAASLAVIGYVFSDIVFEPQSKTEVTPKRAEKHVRGRERKYVRHPFKNKISAQATHNTAYSGFIEKVYALNCYEIVVDNMRVGTCLFIKGKHAIIPFHYIDYFETSWSKGKLSDEKQIMFRRCSNHSMSFYSNWRILRQSLTYMSNSDFSWFEFGDETINHRDLSTYFLPKDSSYINGYFNVSLMLPRSGGKYNGYNVKHGDAVYLEMCKYDDLITYDWIEYPIDTEQFDCGAPIFLTDTRCAKPIILGVHTAGNGERGGGAFIHLDDIKDYFGELDVSSVSEPLFEAQLSTQKVYGNSTPLYDAPTPYRPTRTVLTTSKLEGKLANTEMAAAKLRAFLGKDGSEIDPWVLSEIGVSRPAIPFNIELLKACTKSFSAKYHNSRRMPRPWEPRVFTYEEAVAGISGVPFCEGIPRGTSPGYPENMSNPLGGKHAWWGFDGEYNFDTMMNKQLESDVCELLYFAAKGIRKSHVYANYLKDEKLKKAKVLEGRTRPYNAGPLKLSVAQKMYFGDFVRDMMSNNVDNGCCVGINPYSVDWDRLVNKLRSKGRTKKVAGDFKKYDASLFAILQCQVLTVIEDYYYNATDEDRMIRYVLFQEQINSKHIGILDVIVEWFGSNPSGSILTTPINNGVNHIGQRYATCASYALSLGLNHLTLTPELYMPFLAKYEQHVENQVFGDDNENSVTDEFCDFYNQQTLTRGFAEIGFVYTDEDKTGAQYLYRDITETSFLKRGFSFDERLRRWVAPLKLSSIIESCLWTKRKVGWEDQCSVFDRAVLELSLHDQSTFDEWVPKIKKLVHENYKYVIPLDSYRDCRAKTSSLEYYL